MKRYILAILIGIVAPVWLCAQESNSRYVERMKKVGRSESKNVAVSTNVFDWGDFGTINAEVDYAVSRYITLQADLKYNPWEFKSGNQNIKAVYNKQMSAAIGVRYWPWYVFSGWWICGKVQYTDYSITGVWRPALDTGKALGAGLSAGYTFMLTKNLNLEVGAGFWGGGLLQHAVYHSPGGDLREQGPKGFIAVNDIKISVQWLF